MLRIELRVSKKYKMYKYTNCDVLAYLLCVEDDYTM